MVNGCDHMGKSEPLKKPETKLSQRIRELRKERDWSQEYLGSLLGVEGTSVNRYEKSSRDPGTSTLMLLADIFDVSIDYLTGRTDERKPVSQPEKSVDEEINNLLSEIDTLALHKIGDYTESLPLHAKKQLKEIIIAYLKTFPKED